MPYSSAVNPLKRSLVNRLMEKREYKSTQRRLIDKRRKLREGRRINLVHEADRITWAQILELFYFDWYHLLLTLPWRYIALLTGVIQALHILVFGVLYLLISDPDSEGCNLNSEDEELPFEATFGFSLITMSTVGYGTLDDTPAFFKGCAAIPVVVFFQVITFITLDGFLINLFYQRLGRADPRANRIIFSKKAVINFENGKFFFRCQVYDLEKNTPLIESHVRCYVVRNAIGDADDVDVMNMRLCYPDDDFGSFLFLGLPVKVCHEIDNFSPLYPVELRNKLLDYRRDYFVHDGKNNELLPGIGLRQSGYQHSSIRATCPVCGAQFLNPEGLINHVKYNQLLDREEDKQTRIPSPVISQNTDKFEVKKRLFGLKARHKRRGGNHLDIAEHMLISEYTIMESVSTSSPNNPFHISKDSFQSKLQQHFEATNLEIIVLVEAIEPGASGTFQAKCSYKISDIEFNCEHRKCVYHRNGKICIDLNAFNDLE